MIGDVLYTFINASPAVSQVMAGCHTRNFHVYCVSSKLRRFDAQCLKNLNTKKHKTELPAATLSHIQNIDIKIMSFQTWLPNIQEILRAKNTKYNKWQSKVGRFDRL